MEPLPQSATPIRPKDRVVQLLEEMLRDAVGKESDLMQQLVEARKAAQECRDLLSGLGFPHSMSQLVERTEEIATPIKSETNSSNTSTEEVGKVSGGMPSEASLTEETEPMSMNDILRGVTQFLLSAVEQPTKYGVSVFDSESAAQAYVTEKQIPATVDFSEIRNRVGQALSRLTLRQKILKFQEKGRPSKIKYLSVSWVNNDGDFLPEHLDAVYNLEPVNSNRSTDASTSDDNEAMTSNLFPAVSSPQKNNSTLSSQAQPAEDELEPGF